jgi:hypothetical protein
MKSAMQNSILLTLVFFSQMNSPGVAQNQEANHSLERSTWSLQFQISNNFTLSSFQGSVISAKYHFSKQRAFRFGSAISGGR